MKKFELGIDHPILKGAKQAFSTCMKIALQKAIETGSMEGSATVKISFEIYKKSDEGTGEIKMQPDIKFKAGYSVPMKDSIDGSIVEESEIRVRDGDFILINNQISMEELLEDEEDDERTGD